MFRDIVLKKAWKCIPATVTANIFTAIRQLKTILYAQLAGKDSLREVESGLLMNANRMYHLDMEPVSRSTLSDAMNRRSPEIFRAMFEEVLDRALACAPGHGFKFKNPLYAIDSTTIALSLTVYNWAKYRKQKGAIKLHTQLDLSGNLPFEYRTFFEFIPRPTSAPYLALYSKLCRTARHAASTIK